MCRSCSSSTDPIWVNATATAVDGLTNGTEYDFEVRAVNTTGDGAAAAITATPYKLPAAPTDLAAWGRSTYAVLRWNLFDASITRFEYQQRTKTGQTWDDWGSTWTDAQPPTEAPLWYQTRAIGLTNGTEYQFRVRAVNPAGAGPPSAPIAATPRASLPPLAPTNVRAYGLDGRVQVTWTTPALSWDANTPDTRIAGYQYRTKQTTASWPTTGRRGWSSAVVGSATTVALEFRNRTNGTPYDFQIRAVSLSGTTGAASAEVSATPTATSPPPAAPAGLGAARQTNAVALSWRDPADTSINEWRLRVRPHGSAADVVIPKATSETITLSWSAPSSTAGITKWQYSTDGTNWTDIADSSATTTTATITASSLTVGTSYTYQVRGWIAANNTVTPTGLEAWTQVSTSASYAAHTVSGLTGATYAFSVRAVNATGAGAPSTVRAKRLEAPAGPVSLVAYPRHQSVELEWYDADDSTITKWQYRRAPSEQWTDICTTSRTALDLPGHHVPYRDRPDQRGEVPVRGAGGQRRRQRAGAARHRRAQRHPLPARPPVRDAGRPADRAHVGGQRSRDGVRVQLPRPQCEAPEPLGPRVALRRGRHDGHDHGADQRE